MKRTEWLRKRYDRELAVFGADVGVTVSLDDLLEADPTQSKRYSDWLIRTYLAGGFRSEDLYKATETLEAYIAHKNSLDLMDRDINSYSTLSSLWIAVSPFLQVAKEDEAVSGKEQKRRDQAMAREQSIMLVDEPDFKVAIPLTEYAAKWWGRGTRWCTSADERNAFRQYHERAPLIVFVLPNGKKLQLHVTEGDVQFMGEDDAPVDRKTAIEHWDHIGPYIIWAVKLNGLALSYVPETFLSEELYLDAVRSRGIALSILPEAQRTAELCEIALKQSPWAIGKIPRHLCTEEMIRDAVTRDGEVIKSVRENFLNEEICMLAVKSARGSLGYIPKQFRTYQICLEAIKRSPYALHYIPPEFINEEIVTEVVRHNGRMMGNIPVKFLTVDLYIESLKTYGLNLSRIPEHFKSYEICMRAVKNDGGALAYVPDKLKDEAMCLEAVKKRWNALSYVPLGLRTEEICLEALRKDADAFCDVPKELLNSVFLLKAVKQNGAVFGKIPTEFVSHELRLEASIQKQRAIEEDAENILMMEKRHSENVVPQWQIEGKYLGELRGVCEQNLAFSSKI